jgi:hypothetical protein
MITGLAHLPRTPTSVRLTARRTSLWAPRDVRKDATGVLRQSGGGRHCPPSLDRRATVGPTGSAGPPSLPANRGVDQPSGTKRLGVDSRSSSGERRAARRERGREARARTRGESAAALRFARRERGREARARTRGESADARRERGREARARTRGESADARRERGGSPLREARARRRDGPHAGRVPDTARRLSGFGHEAAPGPGAGHEAAPVPDANRRRGRRRRLPPERAGSEAQNASR